MSTPPYLPLPALRHGIAVQQQEYRPSTLTGAVTLVYTLPGTGELAVRGNIIELRPGTGDRIVTLPDEALSNGVTLRILVPSTETKKVTLKDSGGVSIGIVNPGEVADAFCVNSQWYAATPAVVPGVGVDYNVLGIDATALLTGQFYLEIPLNEADAWSITDGATDLEVWTTTTGLFSRLMSTLVSQAYTRTTAGALFQSALTVGHINAAMDVGYFHNVHSSARDAASIVNGLHVLLDSEAADNAGALYCGLSLETDGTKGVHTGLVFGAGFDLTFNFSAMLTTENAWKFGANLADALSVYDSTGDILVLATTTGLIGFTLSSLLAQAYARTTAGALDSHVLTVTHAANAMDVVYAGNVHNTNRGAAAIVNAFKAVLDSEAADDATSVYTAFKAETDGTQGVHAAFKMGAGFDRALDMTQAATGEAVAAMADNLAVAFALREAANAYLNVCTTNLSESIDLGNATTNPDINLAVGVGPILTNGLDHGTRLVLTEQWHKRVLKVADIATEPANPDFQLTGTNCVSANCTFRATGGLTFTTTAALNDQMIVSPQANTQSAWGGISWAPNGQPIFKAACFGAGAASANRRMGIGLKLTAGSFDAGTDNDQVYFLDDTTRNGNGNWWVIVSINNVDTAVDTGVAVAAALFQFVIKVSAAGVCTCFINDQLVHTTAALTAAGALVPVAGVQAIGAAGAQVMNLVPWDISRVVS